MGKIKKLDSGIIQKIAAGEVVERPASVVKELIENALDAGATRIEIELERGGMERILVSDNGEGMSPDDAALAVVAHATSKLSSLDDFEALTTFGFRGEALASIASVSRFELLTRTQEAVIGTRVAENKIEEAGAPKGTRVVVSDLFYNVSPRKKFLKSISTEEAAALDAISKISLSRLDVGFQVTKNGKPLFILSAGESLKERYLNLFPQTESGEIFEFESIRGSRKVHGLLGSPNAAKSSRNGIFFYVNKRSVRPGLFTQAITEGYSGYLQPGKFPIALIFIEVEGALIDVNVHPMKSEVRFSNTKEIYGMIQSAVSSALVGQGEETRLQFVPSFMPNQPGTYPTPGARYEDLTLFEKLSPYGKTGSMVAERTALLLGTIAKTYAVFQEEETLFMIDLHAAHERVNFDLLQSRETNGSRAAQELLSPYLIEVGGEQLALLAQHAEFLARMGLVFENFGNETIRISAVPSGLEKLGEKKMLLSFIDKLEKINEIKDPEAQTYKMLATIACRASIQAGDEVSREEIEALFPKLMKSTNPNFCPHGRPSLIKLTPSDLHKLFRRPWS